MNEYFFKSKFAEFEEHNYKNFHFFSNNLKYFFKYLLHKCCILNNTINKNEIGFYVIGTNIKEYKNILQMRTVLYRVINLYDCNATKIIMYNNNIKLNRSVNKSPYYNLYAHIYADIMLVELYSLTLQI